MIPTKKPEVQSRELKQRARQVSLHETEHKQNHSIPSLSATGCGSFTDIIFWKRYSSNPKAKSK